MRILHCIYDDPGNPWVGGGGAVRLHEIYSRLGTRLDVTLATGNFPGAHDRDGAGFRSIRLGAKSPYAWSRLTYARAATEMLHRAEYDVAVFDFSAYTPIRIPRDRPVGVMLGQLTGSTARGRWGRIAGAALVRWEAAQLGRARWIAAVSPALLEEAEPMLRPGADKCVIGVGVNEELFAVERSEKDYVLFYGRFDVFQKGIDILLDAFARVIRHAPRARLKIAGRGKDETRIVGIIRERSLEASVDLIVNPTPGRVRELMAGALMLVMPSRFEGFGMVAAEAMAAGVPVIGTSVGGIPAVLERAGGIMIPGEDAAATASAVLELLETPERRADISSTARERARRWTWNNVAEDHVSWLERISREAGKPEGS